jgi:hypothetical protein|tara:strand:+ start:575 stop:1045 length:471 start_codon:yes stop_codon:yes gene_type:complete
MNIGISLGSAALSAILGRQILTQAITDASASIYSTVGDVFHHTASIDKVLCQLDIENKVKTIELLCNSLPSDLKKEGDESAINFCLENLHDMVIRIREDLKQLKAKIDYHKSKWFTSWRSLDARIELANLKLHTSLLEQRYDLFVKTQTVTNMFNH